MHQCMLVSRHEPRPCEFMCDAYRDYPESDDGPHSEFADPDFWKRPDPFPEVHYVYIEERASSSCSSGSLGYVEHGSEEVEIICGQVATQQCEQDFPRTRIPYKNAQVVGPGHNSPPARRV